MSTAEGLRPDQRARLASRAVAARVWFGALLVTICFEGLGRKYLTAVPSIIFYFAKDLVLLAGLARFGIAPGQLMLSQRLLGVFRIVLIAAFAWTFVQMFNPQQPSLVLALIGLRAYWLWWIAPLVIASALREDADRRVALQILCTIAAVVAVMAAVQFAAPASSALNAYARFEGQEIMEVAVVTTTGRARVSSTFSFLSGFTDFVVLVPPLLLALGIGERDRKLHWLILGSAAASLAVMPMSGSRGPLFFAAIGLTLVLTRAGFMRTKTGRRVLLGGAIAVTASILLAPEALEGVNDRFQGTDTMARFRTVTELLPPVAMSVNEYPGLGDGTGTQQNARLQFGIRSPWSTEGEASRLLAELGVVGYLLIWLTKVGLTLALLRVARFLKASGQAAMSGGALAFAFYAFTGNSAFDHIWQSLFFVGVGLLFLAVESSVRARAGVLGRPGARS